MNPERWDYWDSPDPERPPIPWHEAPYDATHALWSDKLDKWYFWHVNEHGTTCWWQYGGAVGWRHHVAQRESQQKLKDYLKAGQAFLRHPTDGDQPDNDEGYTPMNLNNAALLVRDDITTVEIHFPDNKPENTFTYILHNSIEAAVNEEVLVQRKEHLEVGTLVKIDAEPQINVNSNVHYKWVIANVTGHRYAIDQEIAKTHTIARALKQRQAANVRDQILAQFGVANAAELMALGSDNAQSE